MSETPTFKTLQDVYLHSQFRFAERPLFGTRGPQGWEWLSYRGFGRQVDTLRTALAGLGIQRGDRVAIVADNRVEWAVALHATVGLGACFVPMYAAQRVEEQVFILGDCRARVLLVADSAMARQLQGRRDQLPSLEHLFVLDGEDQSSDWAQLMRIPGGGDPVPMRPVTPSDPAAFIYTSGTTGDPKGVILSHGNLASNVQGALAVFPIAPEDRSLSFLPWAHCFGQTAELHAMYAAGASMGLAESVPKLLDNIAEVRPTILISVPRIFNRIYDRMHQRMDSAGPLEKRLFDEALANARLRRELAGQGQQSLRVELKHAAFDRLVFSRVRERFGGRLRYAVSGGAALSTRVAEFIEDVGIVVFEGYGLTETSPVVATNTPKAHRIGSVGKPLPGVRVVLDHSATEDVVDGEIVVYGPGVMRGYHQRPHDTAGAFTEDGGFRTGDMGRLDEDGFLYITGRIKEQYKLENGKYVVPSPLEEELQLAPLVGTAVLCGHNRPHNVALVVPDWDAVALWAANEDIPAQTPEQWVRDTRLQGAIQAQVDEQAAAFKRYERPRAVGLVAEAFTVESGLLTPSLKVKRRAVLGRYSGVVEGLWA
ncbi:MAG: AMP-dependent synthetase/ligase [Myxococcota bacterium]|nr:AMP-dependent synthetase/ligase [Myxococcota bacterium]